MKHMYTSLSGLVLVLAFSADVFAQNPKPQNTKELRFTSAQPMGQGPNVVFDSFRGGLPDECAQAQVLTVGGTCSPVVVSTVGATQSLPPILCNGFTSPGANDVWFSLTATSESTIIEVLGTDDYDAVIEVFTGTCGTLASIGCVDATFPPNSTLEVGNITGDIGTTYYIRVYTYTSPVPVSTEFTICAYGGDDPPANDDCTGAVAQALAAGSTITFTGDNTGATEDLPGFTMVWEAFTTTVCTDVVVDYCVPGSVFENFFVNLAPNCPDILDGILTGENDECTVTFLSLPPGTYYVPVMAATDGTTPEGAYSVSVIATACPPGYCAASAALCDEYIARVQFGTIDNVSGCSDGPVVDYTAISATIGAGSGMMMTVTNGPDVYPEDQVVAWVDWNQNESFLDAGEAYTLVSGDGALTFTGTITAPPGATLGSTRMRIRMMYTGTPSPCGGSEYGEVEDYTVNVIMGGAPANDDCADATTLTVNGPGACPGAAVAGDNGNATDDGGDAACDPTDTQFQDVWYTFNSGSNTQVTIDIGAGTIADLVIDVMEGGCAGTSVYCDIGTNTNVVDVDPNTDYVVRIASNNDWGLGGTFTICLTGESSGGGYCSAGADGTGLGLDERIVNVTVAGIDNDSPDAAPVAPAYSDFTSVIGMMEAGSTYPVSIGVNSAIGTTYNTNQALVWIDLNHDEDFDDAGELVFVSDIDAVTEYTGDIAIPMATMPGITRMRVRLHDTYVGPDYVNNFNDTPCGIASYGEVEDYTIVITEVGGGGYCLAGADGTGLGLDERIINVTVADIDNDSPNVAPVAPAYSDFTSIIGTMQAGSMYPVSIGVSSAIGTTYNTNQALVWIDLNHDEDFDDAGELVFVSAIDAVNEYAGDIAIPLSAMVGNTRMRVRLHDTYVGPDYVNNFNDTPCGIASYGEVEDYTIMIDAPTSMEDLTTADWNVFPNPGNGDMTIRYGGVDALVRISMLDMSGRLLHDEQRSITTGGSVAINLAGRLAAGAYLLRLTSVHGQHEQRVIVR